MITVAAAWQTLESVRDPEIPVVSVVELGIIRSLEVDGGTVRVTMTPTFAGCPALHVMQADIEAQLRVAGAARVEVRVQLNPPWSTDQITESGRAKLKDFGLAPPPRHGGLIQILFTDEAACPHCGSADTELKNSFGPTLCRAIYYCHSCQQPFEQFKPL